jgi:hypothetical protein
MNGRGPCMQMDRQTLSGRLIDVQYSAQTKRDVLHLPSLTSRHSSHSTRQPTADRLVIAAFLHISSIDPNQKLHARPLRPSIRSSSPDSHCRSRSSAPPAVSPNPSSSVTIRTSDRGGNQPARLLSSTVYCRTSGRAGSFLTTRSERLTSSPTGRR